MLGILDAGGGMQLTEHYWTINEFEGQLKKTLTEYFPMDVLKWQGNIPDVQPDDVDSGRDDAAMLSGEEARATRSDECMTYVGVVAFGHQPMAVYMKAVLGGFIPCYVPTLIIAIVWNPLSDKWSRAICNEPAPQMNGRPPQGQPQA